MAKKKRGKKPLQIVGGTGGNDESALAANPPGEGRFVVHVHHQPGCALERGAPCDCKPRLVPVRVTDD